MDDSLEYICQKGYIVLFTGLNFMTLQDCKDNSTGVVEDIKLISNKEFRK